MEWLLTSRGNVRYRSSNPCNRWAGVGGSIRESRKHRSVSDAVRHLIHPWFHVLRERKLESNGCRCHCRWYKSFIYCWTAAIVAWVIHKLAEKLHAFHCVCACVFARMYILYSRAHTHTPTQSGASKIATKLLCSGLISLAQSLSH